MNNNSNKNVQSEKLDRLDYLFTHSHALTNRYLLSSDPEGLAYVGGSIIVCLEEASKIALEFPKTVPYINKEIDKLIKHAEYNIETLQKPNNIKAPENIAKVRHNKALISRVFLLAKEDINNGRVFDAHPKHKLKNSSKSPLVQRLLSSSKNSRTSSKNDYSLNM